MKLKIYEWKVQVEIPLLNCVSLSMCLNCVWKIHCCLNDLNINSKEECFSLAEEHLRKFIDDEFFDFYKKQEEIKKVYFLHY